MWHYRLGEDAIIKINAESAPVGIHGSIYIFYLLWVLEFLGFTLVCEIAMQDFKTRMTSKKKTLNFFSIFNFNIYFFSAHQVIHEKIHYPLILHTYNKLHLVSAALRSQTLPSVFHSYSPQIPFPRIHTLSPVSLYFLQALFNQAHQNHVIYRYITAVHKAC